MARRNRDHRHRRASRVRRQIHTLTNHPKLQHRICDRCGKGFESNNIRAMHCPPCDLHQPKGVS
ncbi:TPA_asm: hypothetical protein PROPHIFSQJ01-1_32 [Mycobacterium phage prophiFSQJ01-1]|nr:TPA_asm: hypothetical protein PROPHIFSQJ01-1_32 [Mycobacterium phage prophiFSQJ01-1]